MPIPNYYTTYAFYQDLDPFVAEELANAYRSKPSIARINTPAWFNKYLNRPSAGLVSRDNYYLQKDDVGFLEDLQGLLDKNQRKINNDLTPVNGEKALGVASAVAGGIGFLGDVINEGRGEFTWDDYRNFNISQGRTLSDYNRMLGLANTTNDLLQINGSAPDFIGNANSIKTKEFGIGGMLKGAGTGAAIGTQILPGIGTAIGAGVGFLGNLIGQGFGVFGDNKRKQQAQQDALAFNTKRSLGLMNAQNKVSTNTYRQGMANYLNNAAMGGPLSTHGSDFTDDLIRIDAGGSHERNPLGGVPAGVDPQGIPNLVEEGETIWDDYVFSKRLKAPKALVKKYGLGGGKKAMSYSEAARKASEKSGADLRPNDPISKRTKEAILTELEESQEEKRIAKEQKDMIKAMSEMSPEEFEALFTQQPSVPQAPIEGQIPPQGVNEGMPVEEPLMQEPVGYEPTGLQGFALGGHILDGEHGESRKETKEKERIETAIKSGNLKWDSRLNKWVGGTGIIGEGLKQYSNDYLWNILGYNPRLDPSDRNNIGPSVIFNNTVDEINAEAIRELGKDEWVKYTPGYTAPGMDNSFFSGITGGLVIAAPTLKTKATGKSEKPIDFESLDTDKLWEKVGNIPESSKEVQIVAYRKPGGRGSGSSSGSGSTKSADTTWTPKKIFSISGVNPVDQWRQRSIAFNPKVTRSAAQKAVEGTTETDPENTVSVGAMQNKMLPTWMRYAPLVGGGLSVLSDIFSRPDYSAYEDLIADSRRLESPVTIPVETVGNRMRRNPFDERLSVNQANQNLAAGLRSTRDNAGGNRAYRQFANSLMAYNNQAQLSDIVRNAYLANRQDAFQTGEFNRGTDMYNASAINQRNIAQAQLNSGRGYQGYMARANAINALENARRYDDQMASADLTSFMQSLHNVGNENEWRNWLTSLGDEGVLNYLMGRNGRITFSPDTSAKCGGKIKTKKRRF